MNVEKKRTINAECVYKSNVTDAFVTIERTPRGKYIVTEYASYRGAERHDSDDELSSSMPMDEKEFALFVNENGLPLNMEVE